MNLKFTLSMLVAPRALVAATSLAALAASGGGGEYDISWHTIDGGGGTSSGGGFELAGSIGQHDAGGPMTGGDFALTGGFWAGGSDTVETCPADITGDNQVDVTDMLALLSDWGACSGCDGDLTGDGMVNALDLLNLLSAWGSCP